MNTPTPTPAPSVPAGLLWTGRILGFLPAPLLLFSAYMKLSGPPQLAEGFSHLGIPLSHAVGLGILEIACTVVYLVPQTAVLGAVLLTGYLGGAIQTHVRVGDPVWTHIILGLAIWGGLWLREPRLRALLPLRR